MPGPLTQFKKDLESLVIRFYIESALKNFDPDEIYIIYDGNKIEIYDRDIFAVKKARKEFKSYLISRPARII